MKKHLELGQKAMVVLNEIEKTYGDPHDEKMRFEKTKQIRAVGQKLHDAGGMDLMLAVCEAMRISRIDGLTTVLNREIEFSWDGIGDWQR